MGRRHTAACGLRWLVGWGPCGALSAQVLPRRAAAAEARAVQGTARPGERAARPKYTYLRIPPSHASPGMRLAALQVLRAAPAARARPPAAGRGGARRAPRVRTCAAAAASAALRDMYLELERAEAGAEAREIACVAAATNAAQAAACTAEYLDAADAVEGARLAAAAAGASTGGERAAANAAVMEVNKAARTRVAAAQERELACIEHGGGAECTVAFLADADAAEADARDAVRRYRNILRRWVSVHGSP